MDSVLMSTLTWKTERERERDKKTNEIKFCWKKNMKVL